MTCTCHIHPCQCTRLEDEQQIATCPKCDGVAPWPDGWEIGGMSIADDLDPDSSGEEEDDDGRVFCPHCHDIVVPVVWERAATAEPPKENDLPEQRSLFDDTTEKG